MQRLRPEEMVGQGKKSVGRATTHFGRALQTNSGPLRRGPRRWGGLANLQIPVATSVSWSLSTAAGSCGPVCHLGNVCHICTREGLLSGVTKSRHFFLILVIRLKLFVTEVALNPRVWALLAVILSSVWRLHVCFPSLVVLGLVPG